VEAVRFKLLGPVAAIVDGRAYGLARAQTRGLFAYLLLNAGRPVAVDAAIDALWGGAEPSTARSKVFTAVSRIRRELARLGVPDAIVSGPFGYEAVVEPERVDALAFEQGLRRALASADGRLDSRTGDVAVAERANVLRETLDGWGGQPLQDATGSFVEAERARLTGLRLTAIEELAEADLSLGNAVGVVLRLTGLVQEYPLRERVRAYLMMALYRCGQTAEALDVFRSGRAALVDELGIEPGPELQSLHERILGRDPDLAAPPPLAGPSVEVAAPAPAGPVPLWERPRQLPAAPQLFTGRTIELAELNKIHDSSTVVITAIDGMAGVGKTALAVHAAHQMVDHYPDGQLFIDLHGYTHGVAPVDPGEALDWLLRSLGVPGERIPAVLEQRAALYRSRLADLRMLIVLDNAATEAQVRPLLPGAPGCVALVTSRRRLAGLDNTHVVSLDTLPLPDAVALLRQAAGEDRLVGQSAELAAELVESCGRLPLAIRIAAARLRSHPAWDLAHLVRLLRDQQRRLVELTAGQRSVTAALDMSYQDLGVEHRRTYRLLGLHVGGEIDVYVATALLDATPTEMGPMFEILLEAHLLQEPVPGRYRFHDLIRAHAIHLATRDETEHGQHAALDRLLDYYRHAAAAAMDAVYPYEREHRPKVPPARTPTPDLSDPAMALRWLNGELPNLLNAARYATEHDRPAHVLHLSSILHRHLRTRGPYHDAVTLHQQALTIARATGNQAAELDALTGIGHMYRLQGRSEQAAEHYQQALRLARAADHKRAESEALTGIAHMYRLRVRHEEATDLLWRALRLARATGHKPGELDALTGLGIVLRFLNRYEQASELLGRALELARAMGHRTGELNVLIALADIDRWQRRYEPAIDHYQQALQLARVTDHRFAEQAALTGLGIVQRLRGRYEQAADTFQLLLDLGRQSGHGNSQFEAWQGLGRVHHSMGDSAAALTHHVQALSVATEIDQPDDQARAHDGLAHAHRALDQPEQASAHWRRALDILTRLGIDHTDDEETTLAAVRAHLANLETDAEAIRPTA
jgi:DNA-binding SARP family transcriptional activator/Tfp pilus assembly protein PilF